MWKKAALTIFVVGFLMFSFGVKKSWATVGNPCCVSPLTFDQANPCCSDGTACVGPPTCDYVGGTEVCNVADSPPVCICDPAAPPGTCNAGGGKSSPFDPCKNLTDRTNCQACTGIKDDGTFDGSLCSGSNLGTSCGTWTSIGCIPNDPTNLVGYILRFGSGIAGAVAFLLILFGAAQIVMSGGVPEKIAGGKEVITSAVVGLVFIFVSVLVLETIGVKILGIPGWS